MMKIEDAIRIAHEIYEADDQACAIVCYNEDRKEIPETELGEYASAAVYQMMGIVVVEVFGRKHANE